VFSGFYVAALCNLGFTICGSYTEQVWPPLLYKFRYLTDFQENNKYNTCFVTISSNIQVKYCRLDDR